MKITNSILIFLCCFFLPPVESAQIPSRTDSAGAAYLTVKGDQANLKIFLDGEEIGMTPLSHLEIQPGEHRLVARSSQWLSMDIMDYDTTFIAIAGDTLTISPRLRHAIRLTSIPYGADVFRNHQRLGQTPLLLYQRPGDQAMIRLEKEGYESWEQVVSDRTESIETITLQPRSLYQQHREESQQRNVNKIKWYRRGLYGSILLGAISGIATIHYRGKGNDAYAAYLETANPRRMDHFYDRARHYDRIAGWNYAVFEVSFILSGYFFLKSRK